MAFLLSQISLARQSRTFVEKSAQARMGGISRRTGKPQRCCEPASRVCCSTAASCLHWLGISEFPDLGDTGPPLQTRPYIEMLPQQIRIWFVCFWCGFCELEQKNWFLFLGVYCKYSSGPRAIWTLPWFVDISIVSPALLIQEGSHQVIR